MAATEKNLRLQEFTNTIHSKENSVRIKQKWNNTVIDDEQKQSGQMNKQKSPKPVDINIHFASSHKFF